MSVVSRQRLAAFHATHYQVQRAGEVFTRRFNERSFPLQRLHQAHAAASSAYLTTWNPLGEQQPLEANVSQQAMLLRYLQKLGLVCLPSNGVDPATGWAKESVLAIRLSREQAIALGNQYQQLAIVFNSDDAIPELIVLQ